MSKAIYKYEFMMNGNVGLISLAENEEIAEARVKRLFGNREKYEMVKCSFSHNSGEFTINTPKLVKQLAKKEEKSLPEVKHDLMSNVMDAYAKDKKITL